jgi:hypothetical protein
MMACERKLPAIAAASPEERERVMHDFLGVDKPPPSPPPSVKGSSSSSSSEGASLSRASTVEQSLRSDLCVVQEDLGEAMKQLALARDALLCPLCNKREKKRRDTVFLPCRHLAGCSKCCKGLANCPQKDCGAEACGFLTLELQ